MAGKLSATVILAGPDGEPHTFGPDSDEIPDWAAEKMGEHCWEDGKKPAAKKAAASKADKG